VSFKNSAADYSVGDVVTGKVTKIMSFGVFVDIGASTDVLAPAQLLAKDTSEYSVGEELTDLSIAKLDVQENKISVGQVEAKGGGSGGLSMDGLTVGQQIEGIVKNVREYGVFMDIGLGRKDALLPATLFGEAKMEDFKADSKISVFTAAIDKQQDRITLSVDKPSASASLGNINKSGAMLKGFTVPDPQIWQKQSLLYGEFFPNYGNYFDEIQEPVDWFEWEKRLPDLIKIRKDNDLELYFGSSQAAKGFNGAHELNCQAVVHWLPVPVHLRKPDAGPAEIPAKNYDDYRLTYDYKIKPEIHVKYAHWPRNNPNWTYRPPKAEDFAKAERARLQRAKAQVVEVAESATDE